MDKYRNKYRSETVRLINWDYGSEGMYFITICTKNREHYFGEIIHGEMHLNDLGQVVRQEWEKTPQIRPDMNLELGEFIVMPNHFHAILIIGKNEFNSPKMINGDDPQYRGRDVMHDVPTTMTAITGMDVMHDVPTTTATNGMDAMHGVPVNAFGPQSKNLASVMRGFKSSVTTFARKNKMVFEWQ
jgi:hypothetical protein